MKLLRAISLLISTVVKIQIAVSCITTPHNLVCGYNHYGKICCSIFGVGVFSTSTTEVMGSSEIMLRHHAVWSMHTYTVQSTLPPIPSTLKITFSPRTLLPIGHATHSTSPQFTYMHKSSQFLREQHLLKLLKLPRYTLHKSSFTNTPKYTYSVTKAATVDEDISAHTVYTLIAIFNTSYILQISDHITSGLPTQCSYSSVPIT